MADFFEIIIITIIIIGRDNIYIFITITRLILINIITAVFFEVWKWFLQEWKQSFIVT